MLAEEEAASVVDAEHMADAAAAEAAQRNGATTQSDDVPKT
jgi:hypothetical protein